MLTCQRSCMCDGFNRQVYKVVAIETLFYDLKGVDRILSREEVDGKCQLHVINFQLSDIIEFLCSRGWNKEMSE